MPEFDSKAPPLSVTNPGPVADPNYPRHLHKPDGTYTVVRSDTERDAKLAAGWNLTPGPAPEPEPEIEAPRKRHARD
jgi:hypothetical protein